MLPGECVGAAKVELGLLKCYQGSVCVCGGGGAAKVELGLLKCYQGSVWGLPK